MLLLELALLLRDGLHEHLVLGQVAGERRVGGAAALLLGEERLQLLVVGAQARELPFRVLLAAEEGLHLIARGEALRVDGLDVAHEEADAALAAAEAAKAAAAAIGELDLAERCGAARARAALLDKLLAHHILGAGGDCVLAKAIGAVLRIERQHPEARSRAARARGRPRKARGIRSARLTRGCDVRPCECRLPL